MNSKKVSVIVSFKDKKNKDKICPFCGYHYSDFKEIGFLDIRQLVNLHKKHDQYYWPKLGKVTNGRDYILGLNTKLGIHCGKLLVVLAISFQKIQNKKI